MLRQYSNGLQRTRRKVATAVQTQEWRSRAVSLYEQQKDVDATALERELAMRLRRLTGRTLAAGAITFDAEARSATATVDGVRFRLRKGELVVLRPCAVWGQQEYASDRIENVFDLGRALSGWQPLCDQCVSEDEDWSHSW